MGVLDTLAAATPARDSVTLVTDASLYTEVQAAQAAMETALDDDVRHASMANETPRYDAARDAYQALRGRIAVSEVTFVFERIDPWALVALKAKHAPRTGVLLDAVRGYNFETYLPALVRASCIEVIGADGDTETKDQIPAETWDQLLGRPATPAYDATDDAPARPAVPGVAATLNASQINELVGCAQGVNESAPAVPPSALSSAASQDSGESSAQPSPGTPLPDGGEGGSRPTSPTSSAGPRKTSKKAAAKKPSSGKSAKS